MLHEITKVLTIKSMLILKSWYSVVSIVTRLQAE